MGYRIEYETVGRHKQSSKKNWTGMTAGILVLLLVFGAMTIKTVGLEWVQEVLLPGDPDVTAAALENMVEDLKDGNSFGEAVTAFCKEIMKHAQICE